MRVGILETSFPERTVDAEVVEGFVGCGSWTAATRDTGAAVF
jgi:hypothetical protein